MRLKTIEKKMKGMNKRAVNEMFNEMKGISDEKVGDTSSAEHAVFMGKLKLLYRKYKLPRSK